MISQLTTERFTMTQELVYKRFYKRLSGHQENKQQGLKIEYDFLTSWTKNQIEVSLEA